MKITKSQLKQIIKEELTAVLDEEEVSPYSGMTPSEEADIGDGPLRSTLGYPVKGSAEEMAATLGNKFGKAIQFPKTLGTAFTRAMGKSSDSVQGEPIGSITSRRGPQPPDEVTFGQLNRAITGTPEDDYPVPYQPEDDDGLNPDPRKPGSKELGSKVVDVMFK